MSGKKDIIVVGAGAAGAQIARTLSQQLDSSTHSLTVIESREFYTHYPATLRMLVSTVDKLEETTLIPLDRLFVNGNGKIVRDSVSSISPNATGNGGQVTTASGNSYHYDVLVLASGSIWEGPLAFPATQQAAFTFINEWRERFKKSKGVAIVGGGAVGAELAGEIRDVYPEKEVTIIQRGDHLLRPAYPAKYIADVHKRWAARNIKIVTNDEIRNIPDYPAQNVMTLKGTRINADLVIPTRGGRPNTAYIASLGGNVLTTSGYVKVDQNLQVQGRPGIFAAGDIIDWNEVKQVVKAAAHVNVVVANVKSLLDAKPPTSIYKSPFELLVLTNGAGGGAAYMAVLWGLTFGDWFAKMIKKDLFVAKTRQGLGY